VLLVDKLSVVSFGAMSANSKNANGSTGGGRKKGGGFLSRQAHTKVITEEELLKKDRVAPSDVLRLTRATDSKFTILVLWICISNQQCGLTKT